MSCFVYCSEKPFGFTPIPPIKLTIRTLVFYKYAVECREVHGTLKSEARPIAHRTQHEWHREGSNAPAPATITT